LVVLLPRHEALAAGKMKVTHVGARPPIVRVMLAERVPAVGQSAWRGSPTIPDAACPPRGLSEEFQNHAIQPTRLRHASSAASLAA
jgi:hypothetical protein